MPPATDARRLLLAALVLLSFLFRMIPWGMVFGGGEPLLDQADSYYHLRRAVVFIETFPAIPAVDRYMAYPSGAECPWPPLFDLAVAALSRGVMLFGVPVETAAATVLALLPALLAALTIVPVFFLAEALLGGGAAAVAASFFTALPGHLSYSIVGAGDHHSAETLLLAACYALLFRALAGSAAAAGRTALLSGAALGASALVWQGAVVFAVPVAGGLLLHRLLPPGHPEGSASEGGEGDGASKADPLRAGVTVLATAVLVSAAGRALFPSATEQTRFDFGFFSWFQPAFFLLLLSSLLAAAAIPRLKLRLPRPGLLVLPALGLAAGAILLVPSLRANLAGGVVVLLSRHPWLAGIEELYSPFAFPLPASALLGGARLVELASLFLPVVLAAVAATTELRRRGGLSASTALLVAWTLLFAALAFGQARWQNVYSVNLALSFGWGVTALFASKRKWSRLLAAAASILLAVPSVRSVALLASAVPYASPGRVEALTWLRGNSPPTPYLWDSAGDPGYSVFAYWDAGHHVQWFARRPSLSNNFGYQLRGEGLEESLRIQFAPDEEALLEACARRAVRYLVLDRADVVTPSEGLPALIGIDFEKRFLRVERGADGGSSSFACEEYRSLPFNRLFLDRGSASSHGPALARLRLVHESPSPPGEAEGTVRVFERVKGARVTGRVRPGEEVILACRLDAGGGRIFDYVSTVRADGTGAFEAPFPYATTGPNGSVVPLGSAVAATAGGGRRIPFPVTEEDVADGRVVGVRMP